MKILRGRVEICVCVCVCSRALKNRYGQEGGRVIWL